MQSSHKKGFGFIIDQLTNSMENVVTDDSFETEISVLRNEELNQLTKKKRIIIG